MTHDDDDDTQVYADTLLIVYLRGYDVGKQEAQRKPLTHEQRLDLLTAFEKHKKDWNAESVLIDMIEAAHNIKEQP
jgi:hypothetical protein